MNDILGLNIYKYKEKWKIGSVRMNYIKSMREKVGHDPIFMCACGCLIFNERNQILLQKRSDDGLWGNPGGSMELGETIYDTVIREVKEETNLDLDKDSLKIFNIYSGEEQHHIYPNGDEVYMVNIIFEVRAYRGEVICDSESTELKYFDLADLPTDITKPFACVLRDLRKEQQG